MSELRSYHYSTTSLYSMACVKRYPACLMRSASLQSKRSDGMHKRVYSCCVWLSLDRQRGLQTQSLNFLEICTDELSS